MAAVTGQIGGDNVFLENAATEATLKLLLDATIKSGLKEEEALKELAKKAGLNLDKAKEEVDDLGKKADDAAEELEKFTKRINALKSFSTEFAKYTNQFSSGAAQASNLFEAFGRFNNRFGVFSVIAAQLLKFQEDSLSAYREISTAGANFAGSLSDLRVAASKSYVTLEQFVNIIKVNGDALSRLGDNANEGAKAFAGLSNSLISSDLGSKLLGLGYTTDQLNTGLLNYIATTGGRTQKELSNTTKITESTGAYLEELDALAQITGKTRKEQEDAAKENSRNAAVQNKLQQMTEDQRLKYKIAEAEAFAKGGKGAVDLLQSRMLGLPPLTEVGQQYRAVAGEMADITERSADAVFDQTKTVEDLRKATAEYGPAAIQFRDRMGIVGDAFQVTGQYAQVLGPAFDTANKSSTQGVKTVSDAIKQLLGIQKNQEEREKSEAEQAAETEKSMKELAQNIMAFLAPAVKYLVKPLNMVIQGLAWLGDKTGGLTTLLGAGILAFIAYNRALKAATDATLKKAATDAESGVLDAASKAGGAAKAASLISGIFKNIGFKTLIASALGGWATDKGQELRKKGHSASGTALEIAGDTAQGAGYGRIAGTIIGGIIGFIAGLPAGGVGAIPGAIAGAATGAAWGTGLGAAAGAGKGVYDVSTTPGRASGSLGATGSLFENWGNESLVRLHGQEAVVTPDQMGKIIRTVAPSADQLNSLARIDDTKKQLSDLNSSMTDMTDRLNNLNKISLEAAGHLKQVAEYTKRGYRATEHLSNNIYPAVA
jgi:archaellum component FlaC